MRIHLYGRVSTDHQDNSATSQRLRLIDWAEKQGHEVGGVYIDQDVSGGTLLRLRPQGKLLFSAVQPGDGVAFTKVDRCFRSVADAATVIADWRERGIAVFIIDLGIDVTTPAGELFFNQLACFAQFERSMISQRVRECWAFLKQHQRPYSTARPYGWKRRKRADGKPEYIPCREEREIGILALDLRRAGRSYDDVAIYLMRNDIRKPVLVHAKRKGRATSPYYTGTEISRLLSAAEAGFPRTLLGDAPKPVPARLRRGRERRALMLAREEVAAARTDQQQTACPRPATGQ